VERAAQLWKELQAWLKETGAKIPTPNPDYNPAWAAQQHDAAVAEKKQLEKENAEHLNPDWQPNSDWWKSLQTKD